MRRLALIGCLGYQLLHEISLLDLTFENVNMPGLGNDFHCPESKYPLTLVCLFLEDQFLVEFKFGKESFTVSFESAYARIDWVEAVGKQRMLIKPRTSQERLEEERTKAAAKEGALSFRCLDLVVGVLIVDDSCGARESEAGEHLQACRRSWQGIRGRC